MKNQEFQDKMKSMQEKIGEDASNLILDDIGILLTDNQNMNTIIDDKDKEIARLKKNNEMLQNVNGNLLQQVAMGEDPDVKNNDEDETKKKVFDLRTAFDEKRKFQEIILTFFELYVYNYYVKI